MGSAWRVTAFAALAALAVAVLATTQTGAFVSVAADRPVTVNEVGDDRGYFGIDRETVSVAGNVSEGETLAVFTNRFPRAVDVDVSVGDPDGYPVLENVEPPGTLGEGDAGAVTADVQCDNSTAAQSVTLDIEAEGDGGLRFAASRTVRVECR
ncbi:hypothetical protein ACFQFH_04600 [Halobaculum halobium]|uniref:Uncharacterized protein n=1 Tax=Halobaculum halobium TaxID=3032281 RepID=A0ABD5T831_9EURY|nr:hypothetical protein [Halobaculum sp. SYNS20]